MLLRNIPGILWRAAVQFVSGGSTPFDLIESFDPEAESLSEQEALRRMTFSPINPKTLVRGDGQQVRLFTRPKWVRPDGRTWTPIEQLVDVRYDPLTQGFRVTHNGEWTEMTPKTPFDSLASTNNDGRNFGWFLDSDSAPTSMNFVFTTSSNNVVRVPGGFQLAEYDGVPIGLFFDALRDRFGASFSVDAAAGTMAIDLRDEKTRILEYRTALLDAGVKEADLPSDVRFIDLDPDITQSVGCRQHAQFSTDAGAWDAVRNAPDSLAQTENFLKCEAYGKVVFVLLIARVAMRFDTSNYPAGDTTAADLHLYYEGNDSPPEDAHLSNPILDSSLATPANYAALRTGYESSPITYVDDGGLPGNITTPRWTVTDILSGYASSATFDLGVNHRYDVVDFENDETDWDVIFTATGANEPYLELTGDYGGISANSLLLVGVGI